MISLPTIGVAADREAASQLDHALQPHGCSLDAPTTDAHPALGTTWRAVVLVSEAAAGDPAFVSCVERLDADPMVELLPVSLTARTTEVLPHLSHLRLVQLGVQRTAERIGIVARTGSSDLAAWNRTADRARAWVRAERPRSTALSTSEADAASALLLRPIGSDAGEDREAVVELVAHSRARHRRRVAVVSALVVAVVLVLTGTSIAALDQSRSASAEADRADAASDAARASRLLQSAEDQVAFDPDLPWLLARAAVEADPSAAVRSRAATIVGQLWPHRTVELPVPPVSMVPSRSDRVAVQAFGGHRIDVVDASTGALAGRYEVPSGGRVGAWTLSPDGRALVVDVDDRLLLAALGSTDDPVLLHRGGVEDVEWLEQDRILLAADSTIQEIDPGSGEATTLAEVPGADRITVAPDAGWIAVGHGDSVTLLGVDGAERGTYDGPELSGIEDIQVAFDEQEVTVQVSDGLVHVPLTAFDGVDEGEPEVHPVTAYGAAVRTISSMPGAPSPVCLVDGSLGAVSEGADVLVDTVPAHRGTCLGVTVLPDGSWVSIGSDRMLRHWSAPPVDGYIDEAALSTVTQGLLDGYGTGASVRAMIAAGTGEDQATATAPGAYGVAVIDRETGAVDDRQGLGGIDSPALPSERPGVGVRFHPSTTFHWDIAGNTGTELHVPPVGESQSLLAISPNGRYLAVAGQRASYLLDLDSAPEIDEEPDEQGGQDADLDGAIDEPDDGWDEQTYPLAVRPIGADVDDDGSIRVLTADGAIIVDGDEPTPLMDEDEPLATGRTSPEGAVVAVTATGKVFVGDVEHIVPRGHVDVDLDPVAVHISGDGSIAAVIGFRRTQILRLDDGLVVGEIGAASEFRSVSDVAFDDDPAEGALIVRNDGAVSRIALVDPEQVRRHLVRHAPRSPTRTEVQVYEMEGT